MSEFYTLRQLIRSAWHDPNLADEIDARATAYLRGKPYHRHDRERDTGALRVWTGSGEPMLCPSFQTSRDALQAAHPPGWWFREIKRNHFAGEKNSPAGPGHAILADLCTTPELSELLCILMAWEYEREGLVRDELRATEVCSETFVVALNGNEAFTLRRLAEMVDMRPQSLVQGLVTHSPLEEATAAMTDLLAGFVVDTGETPTDAVRQRQRQASEALLHRLGYAGTAYSRDRL